MALLMNDEQRLAALADYNPASHLVEIRAKDGTLKDYYPANWRLYELNLRYPDANFSTDIVHLDLEHDFAIVKARLYLGANYDLSVKKAEALKQGKASQIDKLDTACKARCARDWGIGTEYALDFTDADGGTALSDIKEAVKTLGLAHNPGQWTNWKKTILGRDIADDKLAQSHLMKLNAAINQRKQEAA